MIDAVGVALVKDPDVSEVEIVRQFLESKGAATLTVPFSIPAEGRAIKMLGTYSQVPDDSEWGVIVQVEEDKAYYDANVHFFDDLGSPGGAAKMGEIDHDHELVAALPPQEHDE